MTSCTYGFYKNGIYKVDYNNSDSYPDGFGKIFVAFIRENTIDELNELFEKAYLVNRKATPSEEDFAMLKAKGMEIDKNYTWEIVSLANYKFLEYYKCDVYFIPDFSDWMDYQDWKYIINLDNNTFDIYKFKNKFVKSFQLDNIPRDWNLKTI